MSLIIKYIATIDRATGVIDSVATAGGGNLPVEGVVGDKEIIRIPYEGWEALDNLTIHEEYYRKDDKWVHRGPRTTPSHKWSTDTNSWVFNSEDFWAGIRAERDQKLFVCDWTQMSDAALTATQKTSWATYRQALRDVPAANSNVKLKADITWPTPPK